ALPRAIARPRTGDILVRLLGLPAVARPADGERARRGRSRARSRAGRVLRARGPDAARALREPRPHTSEPEACARRPLAHDGGRTHAPCGGRGGRGAAALRAARLPHDRAALGPPGRGAEPRSPRNCVRPALGRRRCVLEGGDGACRAALAKPTRAAVWGAASTS